MDTTPTKASGGDIENKAAAKEHRQRFLELAERTNTADPSQDDVRALRRLLRNHPLACPLEDMIEAGAEHLLANIKGTKMVKIVLHHACQQLQEQLGHERASALEKTLIGHVVLAWLRLVALEQCYTDVTMSDKSYGLTTADYWERRLSAAHRRYLRACETLARVRRLQLPTMQMNIATQGGQQVNIAGSGETAHGKN